ncbi:MAG: RagB/SusD family nutrient uptake outer membrane protein [Chitinophagaceae bacterium]
MKKIRLYITVLTLILATSCSKSFLDENPYSSYTTDNLTDSLGFEAAIAGVYYQFAYFYTMSSSQGFLSVWQVGTDVAFATQPQGIETPYYNYATLNSADGAASYTWTWAYAVINDCNIIISGIENLSSETTVTEHYRNRAEAEAKFFRAFAYNVLATCFGGVPITTEPILTAKTDFVRASLDSVNALISSDLLYAVSNLPSIADMPSNSGGTLYSRAHSDQARQLLAEAYLRMDEPALAEAQAQAIIDGGNFQLITSRYGTKSSDNGDCFSDMFFYGNQRRSEGNTEVIWALEQENSTDVVGGHVDNAQQRRVWGAAYYSISGMVICDSLGGRGIARLRLSNWVLYGLYDDGDMRNSQYNIRRRYYYNDPTSASYGEQVPYNNSDTVYKICPSTTKWGQYDPNDAFGYAMIKDIPLMRLGETYLLLAEAQVKQGELAAAAENINVLRNRANAPTVTSSDMDMDFILDERARELIGEENRRMTLMRTKTLVTRAIELNSNTILYPLNNLTSTNLLLPIPQTEIDLNKDAVLEQNPGY